jgi:CRISPR-associated protein Csd2
VRSLMCQKHFDIRTFGAVMSTEFDVGQVRGPVQLTFSRSIEPVFGRDIAITRMAVTNEADIDKERTIGRKHTVAYGLYRGHGFVSASLADKTRFSEKDLRLLWDALLKMFEHDRSAARGLMSTRRLVVFEHQSKLGNAPAHELFERVKVTPRHEGRPARSFADYEVTLDGEPLDQLMTVVAVGGAA